MNDDIVDINWVFNGTGTMFMDTKNKKKKWGGVIVSKQGKYLS